PVFLLGRCLSRKAGLIAPGRDSAWSGPRPRARAAWAGGIGPTPLRSRRFRLRGRAVDAARFGRGCRIAGPAAGGAPGEARAASARGSRVPRRVLVVRRRRRRRQTARASRLTRTRPARPG